MTPTTVLQWRDRALPLADFAVLESWETDPASRFDMREGGAVERLRGTRATANLFALLGVRPVLGRTFTEHESHDVAVISGRLWRTRFSRDPGVLGRMLTLDTGRGDNRMPRPVEIIGILPERFHFTYPEETEIWLPLTWTDIEQEVPFAVVYRAVARLRPDTPLQTVQAAMQPFRESGGPPGTRIWLEPVHDYAVGASRGALLLVSGLAFLVLFGGAVNAGIAFAASAVSRLPDAEVRRALGASRARLVRQSITEAAVFAAVAGAVAVAAVLLALPGLRALLPAGLPGADTIRVDATTLASVAAAAVVSTLVAGLVPAWVTFRSHDGRPEDRRTATMSRTGVRLRVGLLALQFSVVGGLLVVGSMLVQSFWHIVHVDKGFDADASVFVTRLLLMNPACQGQPFERYESDLLTRLRGLPYVDAASLTSAIPLEGVDFVRRIQRSDGRTVAANARYVEADYFDVLRIPLLEGRLLTNADTDDHHWVAVVSQSLADTLYPGENAVGKFLEGSSGTQIVGVVANIRARSLLEEPMPALYWPRTLITSGPVWIMVRAHAPASQVTADIRRIVLDVYPAEPIGRITTLDAILDASVSDRRAYALIGGAFALVVLGLSGLGLSGHLSHVVAERTRDIAIRSALGASPRQQRRVLVEHVVPALAIGLAAALLGSYLLFPFFSSFLFQVHRVDVIANAIGVCVVLAVTGGAVVLSARRLDQIEVAHVLNDSWPRHASER